MTLVEVLIVCMILVILAAVALPEIQGYRYQAQNSAFVTNLRVAGDAFRLYYSEVDDYPEEAMPGVLPKGMEPFLRGFDWRGLTPIGGTWDWDLEQHKFYAGVSVHLPARQEFEMAEIDAMIDDGDLDTGCFRARPNGYIYILEEAMPDHIKKVKIKKPKAVANGNDKVKD